ncbi:hypothetical protein ACLOJK_032599 [Asimina triloba]
MAAMGSVNAELTIHLKPDSNDGTSLTDGVLEVIQDQCKSNSHEFPLVGFMREETPEGKLLEILAEKWKKKFQLCDVADFGLAKLVDRSDGEDCIVTRLVGTPGYLPPEKTMFYRSVLQLQMTTKSDVFAFGVVLAELVTGQRALIRDNRQPNKMKSLISIVNEIFAEEDPEKALEEVVDGNLKGRYPSEELFKMSEVACWCLSEDPADRPEMREIVVKLSQILMASVEWEASFGGSSQVFSGVFSGR